VSAELKVPEQGLEQFVVPTHRCSNCPFSERDRDDGELYCHEDSPKGQAIATLGEASAAVLTAAGRAPKSAQIQVHGIIAFWPQVKPEQSCWKHPGRQDDRRRLEGNDQLQKLEQHITGGPVAVDHLRQFIRKTP
jgi:hypothetical protein